MRTKNINNVAKRTCNAPFTQCATSPKVPGTNGDDGNARSAKSTKSARHQWRHRDRNSAPVLGFGPMSPKVPGTNGDTNGDVRDVRSKRLTKGCGKTCTKIGTSMALKD